jgi:hypothetical protein
MVLEQVAQRKIIPFKKKIGFKIMLFPRELATLPNRSSQKLCAI